MEKYSVTKGEAEVYRIVLEDRAGWADITIEQYHNGGSLKVISDLGDYSHIWTNIGTDKTFKEFLRDLSFEYFIEKTSPHSLIFDLEGSVNEIKQDVIGARRSRSIEEGVAREVYNEMKACSGYGYLDDVDHDYLEDVVLHAGFCQGDMADYEVPAIYKYDEQCLAFWETIWPCFLDAIQREFVQDRLEII